MHRYTASPIRRKEENLHGRTTGMRCFLQFNERVAVENVGDFEWEEATTCFRSPVLGLDDVKSYGGLVNRDRAVLRQVRDG